MTHVPWWDAKVEVSIATTFFLIDTERDKRLKLIDLGAAADLRIGVNYVPNEYLMDPRYAPPYRFIMSTQTPRPPPKPVAAFLSPVLWRMNRPDVFDSYSCGVTLLQMAFPGLRTDNQLIAFNKYEAACRALPIVLPGSFRL